MYRELVDYVHVQRGAIAPDVCDSLLTTLREREWQKNTWYEHQTGKTYSEDEQEPDAFFATPEMNAALFPAIKLSTQSYVAKYAYKDSPRTANLVSRFCTVRFNRYGPGQTMRLHHDHIHAIFDGEERGIPVLSLVGNLNDDYEGGELAFFDGSAKFALGKGDMCLFPSCFLYPHQALEVTSGVRYSFALWAW